MSNEDIEKSVDKTKCVQVLRTERKKGGGTRDVLRWMRPSKVDETHNVVGNQHLLDKNHPQYQPESEDTKPKDPKRKRKPTATSTKQSKTIDSKPKAPKKKRALGSSPLDNTPPAPTHNVIDGANKAHKQLQEQQSTKQSDKPTKPDPSIKQKVKDDLLSKQPKRKSDKPTRADNLRLLKPGEQPPSFITDEYGKLPPGWTNVRVADSPDGKCWVLAKDAAGRTQSKYKPEFKQKLQDEKWERCTPWMDDSKYDHLNTVITKLNNPSTVNPTKRVKDKAISECLQLMLATGIRPGSESDTKAKEKAYGATTLQADHVVKKGKQIFLQFTGKDGVQHNHEITDPKLKKMLENRKKSATFNGWNGGKGQLFDIDDGDIRKALKPLGLKPKDLRTICAMRAAKQQLKSIPPTDDPKEFIKIVNQVCDHVCDILGNRREETFRSYIAPTVWQEWSPNGLKNWQNAKNKGDVDDV